VLRRRPKKIMALSPTGRVGSSIRVNSYYLRMFLCGRSDRLCGDNCLTLYALHSTNPTTEVATREITLHQKAGVFNDDLDIYFTVLRFPLINEMYRIKQRIQRPEGEVKLPSAPPNARDHKTEKCKGHTWYSLPLYFGTNKHP
jgi:hypothetical protein